MKVEDQTKGHRLDTTPYGEGRLSRRDLMVSASCGILAVAAGGIVTPSALASSLDAQPVLSFHRDEPWLDTAGRAAPWRPAHGYQGGLSLERLTDEGLRRLNCYL